ncbi:MAG: SLBB domain-containing protein [Gemmatimonadaceae bacterium]
MSVVAPWSVVRRRARRSTTVIARTWLLLLLTPRLSGAQASRGEPVVHHPVAQLRVHGSVHRPGAYPVDSSTTVADLIIRAGDVASGADALDVHLDVDGAHRPGGVPVALTARVWSLEVADGAVLHVSGRATSARLRRQAVLAVGAGLVIITVRALMRLTYLQPVGS